MYCLYKWTTDKSQQYIDKQEGSKIKTSYLKKPNEPN